MVTFSEPISGLSTATVQLQVGGAPVAADVQAAPDGKSASVTPQAPLPVNATVRLWLSEQLRDQAGNPVSPTGWGFRTAPGTVYEPSRGGTMASGTQLGYAIAQDGDLRRLDRATLAHARSFRVGQRATVPNLPGRWLLVETGPLAGMWVRESATAYLRRLRRAHRLFVRRAAAAAQRRPPGAPVHRRRRRAGHARHDRDRDDDGHGRRQGDHQRAALLAHRRRPAGRLLAGGVGRGLQARVDPAPGACPAPRQSTSARAPTPATATARRAA